MLISNKQFIALQGGIKDNFCVRLSEYAAENIAEVKDWDNEQRLHAIKKIVELSKEWKITSEINILRLMTIYFEKNIKIPLEQPIGEILFNGKWGESKKMEELLFLTYSDLSGLKDSGIQNKNLN